jgi:hypothetical protein
MLPVAAGLLAVTSTLYFYAEGYSTSPLDALLSAVAVFFGLWGLIFVFQIPIFCLFLALHSRELAPPRLAAVFGADEFAATGAG